LERRNKHFFVEFLLVSPVVPNFGRNFFFRSQFKFIVLKRQWSHYIVASLMSLTPCYFHFHFSNRQLVLRQRRLAESNENLKWRHYRNNQGFVIRSGTDYRGILINDSQRRTKTKNRPATECNLENLRRILPKR